MTEIISFKTHYYFPFHFRALGVLIIPVIVVPIFPMLSIGLFFLSFLLITSHYRLEINPELKTYKEILWIFGFKQGQTIPYDSLEYIFINTNKRNIDFGYAVRFSSSKKVFAAYLKLKNGTKLYLGENISETKLTSRMASLADKFVI